MWWRLRAFRTGCTARDREGVEAPLAATGGQIPNSSGASMAGRDQARRVENTPGTAPVAAKVRSST